MPPSTLPALFHQQAHRLGPRPAIRHKRDGVWIDVSWNEWRDRVQAAALGWLALGLQPGDRVAILLENRLEWLLADLSILSAGGVTVPLHAPLGTNQIGEMLADSSTAAVVVSSAMQAAKIPATLPNLKFTISLDGTIPQVGATRTIGWDRLEQSGRAATPDVQRELSARQTSLAAADLASILYTSGTTGRPKGAMLTHCNFRFNAAALNEALGPCGDDPVFFNWLPLSHVYARTVDYYQAMVAGATLILGASPDSVIADVAEIRPTRISSVPRFYEKLLASLPADSRASRLRSIFGPRLAWLGCGGAALAPDIAEAYRSAGFEVVVGYGLTETSPVITTNRLAANALGTVGQPLPGVELALADDGEILTRGPHVMRGYWNQPDATADVLRDHWLHTGDSGQLDAKGFLTITGRKKELIVLSSGKNVAPAPLEGLLASSPLIEQAAIFGDGRPYLVAVVVPSSEATRSPAANLELTLLQEVERLLAAAAPWEQVRDIVVATGPFSVAGEEMTVSMKVRRAAVYEHYRKELNGLY